MNTRRLYLVAALILLLAVAGFRPLSVAGVGMWSAAAATADLDQVTTATLLSDGEVLVTGIAMNPAGTTPEAHPAAETYNPTSNSWTQIPGSGGNLEATLLTGGKILFTGATGFLNISPSSFRILTTTQLFDPTTRSWSPAAPMQTGRYRHTAALLPDGRVLVAGGYTGGGQRPGVTATAELYAPATGQWAPGGSMHFARAQHTATLLPGGRVLVAGGYNPSNSAHGLLDDLDSAEIYDPAANSWSDAAPMTTARNDHTATALPDGRVLVVGGMLRFGSLASAEIFNPSDGTWAATATMSVPRVWHTANLLPSGQVLVAGGARVTSEERAAIDSSELYDPRLGTWAGAGTLHLARSMHKAVGLPGGRVMVIGPLGTQGIERGTGEKGPAAEIYGAEPEQISFSETGKRVAGVFLRYWREHGGLAINGYPISDEFTQVLEDGRAYQVQYFERVRMEYHPENAPPYDVLLGQFGRRLHPADPPVPSSGAGLYFPETGHNVSDGFLAYWRGHGALAQFGYPISEEFSERLEDGKTYVVQYFERVRMEYHPENAPPYDVLLGQFGRRILGGP